MNIIRLMAQKASDRRGCKTPTIVFLGDSVTQGCFELYKVDEKNIQTVFEKEYAYHSYVSKIFGLLFPEVPVNIINAGMSGNSAKDGLERLERDVLSFSPDLTVVCFGLNDCSEAEGALEEYESSLRGIFKKLRAHGGEIIFMTPNMMNTKVSCHVMNTHDKELIEVAEEKCALQCGGAADRFIDAARRAAREFDVPVCDVYAKWKQLDANGVKTTELLSNKINHPTREMHRLFAYSLVETMMN